MAQQVIRAEVKARLPYDMQNMVFNFLMPTADEVKENMDDASVDIQVLGESRMPGMGIREAVEWAEIIRDQHPQWYPEAGKPQSW